MKAPKTTSPELTAEDLLKNIKENIHLIKYREIPWINIMSCPSFLWSSSRESKSKKKKLRKRKLMLGCRAELWEPPLIPCAKRRTSPERKDCSQPTVNANRLVLFLTFLLSTIKNIRCAKNLGGEEDSSQMQWKWWNILYKLFVRNSGRFTLKSQTL